MISISLPPPVDSPPDVGVPASLEVLGYGDAPEFVSLVYNELKRVAVQLMSRERAGHTLQPTALLHEALIRLRQANSYERCKDEEFCVAAAAAMRRVLIDHARKRNAEKRGGNYVRLELDECRLPVENVPIVDLLDLEAALDRLMGLNARHAQVVHLRFFAGLSVDETAALLGVSPTTVKSDWRVARAWLMAQLQTRDA